MANIMMIDACNLRCPYCFANEFVNKDRNEISEENFDAAVSFIVGDGSCDSVGLIGGEPTLHSKFDVLLRKLILDDRVHRIVLYTNGVYLDRFYDLVCHPKVTLLINCNSPADIGEAPFERMCKNIDCLVNEKLCGYKITLGINMYKPNFEFDYFVELLKKYRFNHARVSITVPNSDNERNVDAHGYFLLMKPRVFQFFNVLLSSKIVPNFDCNKIPTCLVTENELAELMKYSDDPDIHDVLMKSNLVSRSVSCAPVIDIRQDLTAVRCFGLSQNSKQPISEFSGIRELKAFYINEFDAFSFNTVYSGKCVECKSRTKMECAGGCLAFKIAEILELRSYARSLMDKKGSEV